MSQDSKPYGRLFGYPLAHTLSPLLHRTIFQSLSLPWEYEVLESLDVDAFGRLLQDRRCYGSAITMPHKVAIIPHLDELTPEGRDVSACNTIFFKEVRGTRRTIGTNTDVVGVREAFMRSVKAPEKVFFDRPALVIGGGGAARSAVYALTKWLRCSQIYIVNRDDMEVEALVAACKLYAPKITHLKSRQQTRELEGPGAIVGCVPDIEPVTPSEKELRDIVKDLLDRPHKGALLEMAYHPKPLTQLAEHAAQVGWQVILGTEAMIWQGLEQARLWTGLEMDRLPIERVKRAIAEELARSQVPELSGMESSKI